MSMWRHAPKKTLTPVRARPFQRVQFLRGTENVYLDLAYVSKEFRSLLDLCLILSIRSIWKR